MFYFSIVKQVKAVFPNLTSISTKTQQSTELCVETPASVKSVRGFGRDVRVVKPYTKRHKQPASCDKKVSAQKLLGKSHLQVESQRKHRAVEKSPENLPAVFEHARFEQEAVSPIAKAIDENNPDEFLKLIASAPSLKYYSYDLEKLPLKWIGLIAEKNRPILKKLLHDDVLSKKTIFENPSQLSEKVLETQEFISLFMKHGENYKKNFSAFSDEQRNNPSFIYPFLKIAPASLSTFDIIPYLGKDARKNKQLLKAIVSNHPCNIQYLSQSEQTDPAIMGDIDKTTDRFWLGLTPDLIEKELNNRIEIHKAAIYKTARHFPYVINKLSNWLGLTPPDLIEKELNNRIEMHKAAIYKTVRNYPHFINKLSKEHIKKLKLADIYTTNRMLESINSIRYTEIPEDILKQALRSSTCSFSQFIRNNNAVKKYLSATSNTTREEREKLLLNYLGANNPELTQPRKELNHIWFGDSLPDDHLEDLIDSCLYACPYPVTLWVENKALSQVQRCIENKPWHYETLNIESIDSLLNQISSEAINLTKKKELDHHELKLLKQCVNLVNLERSTFPNGAAASDILRIMILYIRGGVYMDIDAKTGKMSIPFIELLTLDDQKTVKQNRASTGVLIGTEGSLTLKSALVTICGNYAQEASREKFEGRSSIEVGKKKSYTIDQIEGQRTNYTLEKTGSPFSPQLTTDVLNMVILDSRPKNHHPEKFQWRRKNPDIQGELASDGSIIGLKRLKTIQPCYHPSTHAPAEKQ